MSPSELSSLVAALPGIATRLNAATERIDSAVLQAESMLQSIGLGLQCDVLVKAVRSECRNDEEQMLLCEKEDRLAFKRTGSAGFRICMVHQVSYRQADQYGEDDWVVDEDASHDTPWKNLSRREKIEAAALLPALLRSIADEAHQAIKGYEEAALAIEEVLLAIPVAESKQLSAQEKAGQAADEMRRNSLRAASRHESGVGSDELPARMIRESARPTNLIQESSANLESIIRSIEDSARKK